MQPVRALELLSHAEARTEPAGEFSWLYTLEQSFSSYNPCMMGGSTYHSKQGLSFAVSLQGLRARTCHAPSPRPVLGLLATLLYLIYL